MTRARVMLVFGTRPAAIKLAPLITALREYPGITTRVCVTAQHRALMDQVLAISGITPDIDLDLMRDNQTLDALTAQLLTALGAVFDREKPDRVVVQGDTATTMAGAIAAYHRRIPVSHVEAGLRTGDIYQPWPEEVNRRIVSTIADQHFAPTQTAADALIREAVDPASIHVTGNTGIDALLMTRASIAANPALAAGLDDFAARFAGKRIIAVTAHRRENFAAMEAIAWAVRDIAARDDVAIIFPVHPNPHVRPVMDTILAGLPNVALIDPLDYPHFVRLLSLCTIVLTDSGGVQEEAPALGKPVLVMRETTERAEGIVAGTARLIGTDRTRIAREVFSLLDDDHAYAAMARAHNPFGDGHAAARIAEIIAKAFKRPQLTIKFGDASAAYAPSGAPRPMP